MAYVHGLRCRECGREYDVAPIFTCEWCFGPLEVAYDYDAIRGDDQPREDRGRARCRSGATPTCCPSDRNPAVDLGAGFTPLVRADRLAAELGLGELWIKNDTVNPTNSFKDRVTSVALSKALEFGFKVAACASTGNLANSVAAHAAHAGLRSFVFIPANLEQGKVVTTAVYGGNVVAIDGNYDDVNRLCAELAGTYPWAFVNVNVRTVLRRGLEDARVRDRRAARLGGARPRGRADRQRLAAHQDPQGLRRAVQGRAARRASRTCGCRARRPTAARRSRTPGSTASTPSSPVKPDTIAKSLAIGNPADGYFALDAVRQTGGGLAAVTDDEIVEGMKLLARTEGIFAETAGGVTIATLKRLAAEGVVRPDERVVAYVTGHGLKTLDAVEPHRRPDRGDPAHARRVPRRVPARQHPGGAASMAVTVRIPTQLRELSGGAAEVTADGATVADVLGEPRSRAPGLRASGSSTTRASCAASSTCSSPTRTSASSTAWTPPSADGTTVSIVPAVAGG